MGDVYIAVFVHVPFRGYDVLFPVAAGGGEVAGEGEAGEGGEGYVVCAAYAGFEHAAAPEGDFFFAGELVDGEGFCKAADASGFQVYDASGVEGVHVVGIFEGENGFVETDGRVYAFLELGVVDDVVPGEGLLDHGEVEWVEFFEMVEVVEGVGAVGVDHEGGGIAEGIAKGMEVFDVFVGMDFYLDACVAFFEGLLYFFGECPWGGLDSEGDARADLCARAAEESGEGYIFFLGYECPAGHFDGGFCHVVSADVFSDEGRDR